MQIPRAQELNQQITFVSTDTPKKSTGDIATEGSTVATAWARITEASGSIDPVTQQHEATTQAFEIWVRYNSKITGFTQINWGARTLVITAVPQQIVDINNRRWLVIQAEETVERSLE